MSEHMTLGRFLKRLNTQLERRELGFIAIVVTKWHALGFEAWLAAARRMGYEDAGVVILRPHARFGMSVSRDDVPCANADGRVQVVEIELPKARFLVGRFPQPARTMLRYLWLLRQGTRRLRHADALPVLKIVSPHRANFDILTMVDTVSVLKRYRVSFVITDEGLASYFPPKIWRHARQAALGGMRKAWFIDRFRERVQMTKDRIEKRLLDRFERDTRFLFALGDDRALVPDPVIAADYRRVLASGEWRVYKSPIPRESGRPVALFLTQAWGANGQLSRDAELSTIEAVAERLRNTPYLLVVKLHPHDRADKYTELLENEHVALMENSMVLERILPCLTSADIVVSYNSTALLTAAVLHSIPAFRVGDDLVDRGDTGEWFRDFHREFRVLARHQVLDFMEFEVPLVAERSPQRRAEFQ